MFALDTLEPLENSIAIRTIARPLYRFLGDVY
jgi:hypothetical protein